MICECHLTQQAFLNWEEIIFKSFPVWACMYTELEKQWEKYSLKKEWRDLNDGMTQILPSAKLYLYIEPSKNLFKNLVRNLFWSVNQGIFA